MTSLSRCGSLLTPAFQQASCHPTEIQENWYVDFYASGHYAMIGHCKVPTRGHGKAYGKSRVTFVNESLSS